MMVLYDTMGAADPDASLAQAGDGLGAFSASAHH